MNVKKRVSALLLVFICLGVFLSSCSSDPYSGTYKGMYAKFVGDGDDAKDDISENKLELNEDGTGRHYRDDFSLRITWEVNGENFSMTERFISIEIEYTGTFRNGEIHIFNGDPEDPLTYEYVYKK